MLAKEGSNKNRFYYEDRLIRGKIDVSTLRKIEFYLRCLRIVAVSRLCGVLCLERSSWRLDGELCFDIADIF